MAVSVGRLGRFSAFAGVLAIALEIGANGGVLLGTLSAAVGIGSAPLVVGAIVEANQSANARMEEDRKSYARKGSRPSRTRRISVAAGDDEQKSKQSDEEADDSPDMPRRVGPMVAARESFLTRYDGDVEATKYVYGYLEDLIKDDKAAYALYDRVAERNPRRFEETIAPKLRELRALHVRLVALRDVVAAARTEADVKGSTYFTKN